MGKQEIQSKRLVKQSHGVSFSASQNGDLWNRRKSDTTYKLKTFTHVNQQNS